MRVLNTINLTMNMKRVMAKIIASPTPKLASQQVSTNQSMIVARDQLIRLGFINYNPNAASMTDQGKQVMSNEALTDESGQLTPDGEQLAHSDVDGNPEQDKAQTPPETSIEMPPPAGMDLNAPPPGSMPVPGQPQPGMQMQSDKYERFAMMKTLFEIAKPKKSKDHKAKINKRDRNGCGNQCGGKR